MDARSLLLGLASGVTTFLLVGALTLVAIGDRFGDSPGVGIIAVVVALVVGLVAVGIVALTADQYSGWSAAALVAYATFGVAYLAIAGLSYVNVPGADDVFTFPVHLAASLGLAVVAAILAGRDRTFGGRASV